ncbi:hypothetical protein B0H12DRAFT_711323 [Mycena haematopus]|nr:hypothetical protein B0H12DRAFT_711323 [Mycena haematopus]
MLHTAQVPPLYSVSRTLVAIPSLSFGFVQERRLKQRMGELWIREEGEGRRGMGGKRVTGRRSSYIPTACGARPYGTHLTRCRCTPRILWTSQLSVRGRLPVSAARDAVRHSTRTGRIQRQWRPEHHPQLLRGPLISLRQLRPFVFDVSCK